MLTFFKILSQSISLAIHALFAHKLRSFLSVLGVTIGIFCLIIVFSLVDTLEKNIRSSFEELGSDVLFVHRWSFEDGPPALGRNYWKYRKRPEPTYEDFNALRKKVKGIDLIGITASIGQKNASYRNNNVEGGMVRGIVEDCAELMGLECEQGRYFSTAEFRTGSQKVILGHVIAEELFGSIPPLGKKVKIDGIKLEVIGILKKEGDNILNFANFDEGIMIPFKLASRYVNLRQGHKHPTAISLRGKENVFTSDLKEDIRGALRKNRRLKPREADNFSINEISLLDEVLNTVFFAMNAAGGVNGFFALLVGMFGIANIMFVSVKERTNLIGIKKALGAKSYVILLEFLMEAILLCLFGGILGGGLVGLFLGGISMMMPFDLFLDFHNVRLGLTIAICTGVLAGIIPAYHAAKMNPIVAIRS